MKTITLYQADDGKRFETVQECTRYESILIAVNSLLDTLPNPKKYGISNGDGYIQHEKGIYNKIEKLLVKLSNYWFKPEKPFVSFNYMLGRYIDDSGMNCLNKLSYRLMCIRDDKEYGQPYYANNPDKAKNIKVN